MNNVDPLAELRDIQLPATVSAWPAWGWWIILALVALGLSVAAVLAWQRYRRLAFQRDALKQLEALRETASNTQPTRVIADISALLKQVAMTREGRQGIASLHGTQWLRYLDTQGNTTEFTNGPGQVLGNSRYQINPNIDVAALIDLSQQWIKKQT